MAFQKVAFVLEMLLKMIDRGVVLHEGAYLRDPWNILDTYATCDQEIMVGIDH